LNLLAGLGAEVARAVIAHPALTHAQMEDLRV
jgi:hypothetical protein